MMLDHPHFYRMSLSLGLSGYFLMIMFGLCIFGRNTTELMVILLTEFNQVVHCVSLSHCRDRC